MTYDMEGRFATDFAALLGEGRTIYEAQRDATMGPFTDSMEEKIRDWIQRAQTLARSVRADSVQITGGFPWGLSVSITFSLGEQDRSRMSG